MISVKWEAWVRSVRTLVQGALAAGAIASWEALHTAWTDGTYNPRLLTMAGVAAFAGAISTYVFNRFAPELGVPGSKSKEAFVRMARTLVQGLAGVAAVALWDSLYATWTSGVTNPRDLAVAASAAVVTAVVAYLHNLVQPVKRGPTPVPNSSIRVRLDE